MNGDAADTGAARHTELGATAAPASAAAAVRNPRRVGAYEVMGRPYRSKSFVSLHNLLPADTSPARCHARCMTAERPTPPSFEALPEDWQSALFVVAHPDDIEYGAAAAVARWTGQGKKVVYCMVTSGEAGIDGIHPDE